MWNNRYEALLEEWYNLRQKAATLPIEDSLHLIDDWWAKAPLINNYLHMDDYSSWPLPWDLLAEYSFCDVAKCLGIMYTLLLIEHEDIHSLHIVQTEDEYSLVQINNGQYTLNDQIGEIISDQSEIHVKYSIDCEYFKNKLK